MGIQINRLTNSNVYVDGANFLGRAEEISLPEIKFIMAEHKALGMVGSAEFFAGFEKMESKIKWNALYPDVLKKAANPFKTVAIQARGSLETYSDTGKVSEVAVVAHLRGTFKNLPMGNFKPKDNPEYETSMSVNYAKLVVDGEDIYEIDVLQNIYKVEGQDLLADYRANIGA